MKKNLDEAIRFADKVNGVKGVLQIILFGSVATGEDTDRSDIDVAIVFRGDKFEVMNGVNKFRSEKLQTTFVDVDGLAKETELVGALSGEGILLFGKPVIITYKKLGLSEKVLFSYSLSSLRQTDKVKFDRALHGSVSKSGVGKKIYRTEVYGLVNEPGVDKVANTVLLVDRRKAAKFRGLFKRFGVGFKEKVVWVY